MSAFVIAASAAAAVACGVPFASKGASAGGSGGPHGALSAPQPATDCTFASSYPRQYVAYASTAWPAMDGRLDEPFWTAVPWTEDFVDISTASTPGKRTRAKIRYDDQYLYIGAEVTDDTIWANISSTCHCIDPTHDQVIYHDNDFEIFVDSDGSTHAYKETEVNAAAASWDLLLNKPYNDGGGENSSRVFGDAGFDMWPHGTPPSNGRGAPVAGVATYVAGTLNDPGVAATYWTAEVRLPLADLVYNTTATLPVAVGDFWRINFSRVEWGVQVVNGAYWLSPSCTTCPVPGTGVEDNWVWSPQGSIAMHLPERWGFLQMADANVNATAPVVNPQWPSRQVAMALYYAQHAYASGPGNGSYTDDLSLLLPLTPDPGVIDGTCTKGLPFISLGPGAKSFTASAQQLDGLFTATVRDDRYLTVAGQ